MGIPGSPQTVQRLVDEHYVALYRYAYRLSGSGADAEDLTQDTFCKAQLTSRSCAILGGPSPGCSASFATPTCIASVRTSSRHACRWMASAICPRPCPSLCPI